MAATHHRSSPQSASHLRSSPQSHGPSPISKANTTSGSNTSLQNSIQQEALELQLEMERIKERRRVLDEQRRRLRSESSRLLSPAPVRQQPCGHVSLRTASAQTAASTHHYDTFTEIPSERVRRDHRTKTAELEMKEQIREALNHDSTVVGGYFLLSDNNKNSTFGRAPRFRHVVGMKGQYYLDHDVTRMQDVAKGRKEHYSVRNRGKSGCNVTCQWNSSHGGTAPGPGSYTPLFQKLAPKSVLADK